MRLFVSVDLPEELTDPVADVQAAFAEASGLDFTEPSQAHVTMKFLGETSPSREEAIVDALEAAIAEADQGPFEATYEGLGVFPSLEYISVLWLGVSKGSEAFSRVQEPIERRLVDLGFDEEDHEFTPHVTLARMKHAGGKELVQSLVQELNPTVGQGRVEAVRLTESTLTPDGPVYETRHRVEL